jgi:hypothetical protein
MHWRHDKLDSLFSGFAIKFLEELRKGTPLLRRILGNLLLWLRRFDWDHGGVFAFARLLVLWAFFISVSCFVATHGAPALARLWASIEGKPSHEGQDEQTEPSNAKEKLGRAQHKNSNFFVGLAQSLAKWFSKRSGIVQNARYVASWTGYLLILLLLLERIAKLSDPIKLEARKRILAPEYEKSLGFVEQFHTDLDKIVTAYLGESKRSRRRVFVFIDDLDRCEIPKAAELMQGLNLMISDSPQLVFILGIDRQKIAAALAVKHKEYLPYFPVSDRLNRGQHQGDFTKKDDTSPKDGKDDSDKVKGAVFDPTPGLQFGYSFIEKFIQIAF